MTFLEPTRFIWLLTVPALGVLALVMGLRHRRNLRRFATPERLGVTLPARSRGRQAGRTLLLLACLGLTLVALADPRRGEREREIPPGDGVSVVFALDVSRSMLAQDVSPTRLDRAKQYILELTRVLTQREDDASVGLVAFAGAVKRVTPVTRNVNELELALQATDVTSAGVGGSNLADAVQVAARSFVERRPGHKVVVMLTDGEENLSGEPAAAARAAFEQRGVRFFPLGLGSPDTGATIPLGNGRVLSHEGEAVQTTLDAAVLRTVAQNGGGVYLPAETKRADMDEIYRRVIRPRLNDHEDAAAVAAASGTTVKTMIPRFGWWVWPALVLLLLERAVAGWPARRVGGTLAVVGVCLWGAGAQAQSPEQPLAPGAAYNAAVAALADDDAERARSGFADAARRGVGVVEARARYNLGRDAHMRALAALAAAAPAPTPQPATAPSAAAPADQNPLPLLDQAVREYAAALGADPGFDDARANLEAAARLAAQLRQQQEQEPQRQEPSDDQQPSDDQEQESQEQEQESDNQSSEDQSSDDQGTQGRGSQESDQDPQQGEPSDGEPDQDPAQETEGEEDESGQADDQNQTDATAGSDAPEPATDPTEEPDQEQENQETEEQLGDADTEPAALAGEPGEGEPQELSPDEAMKLLQRIRDQDLQRRITQYRREAQRQQRVEKDW